MLWLLQQLIEDTLMIKLKLLLASTLEHIPLRTDRDRHASDDGRDTLSAFIHNYTSTTTSNDVIQVTSLYSDFLSSPTLQV